MYRIQDLYALNFLPFCQTSVDKALTKKQAERSELLLEETGSKKPRLMESQQSISILMSEGFMIRVLQHLIRLPNLILKKVIKHFSFATFLRKFNMDLIHIYIDIESEYYDFRKRRKFLFMGRCNS